MTAEEFNDMPARLQEMVFKASAAVIENEPLILSIAAAIRAAVAEERERLAGEVEMMLGRLGQSALGLKVADFIRAGGSPPASPPAG